MSSFLATVEQFSETLLILNTEIGLKIITNFKVKCSRDWFLGQVVEIHSKDDQTWVDGLDFSPLTDPEIEQIIQEIYGPKNSS